MLTNYIQGQILVQKEKIFGAKYIFFKKHSVKKITANVTVGEGVAEPGATQKRNQLRIST